MPFPITTQHTLRAEFWHDNPALDRRRNPRTGDYPTDTRCAFVDYVDSLCRDGTISEALASRATL